MALDVKINFANFVAFPITFGIGVDYSVNLNWLVTSKARASKGDISSTRESSYSPRRPPSLATARCSSRATEVCSRSAK